MNMPLPAGRRPALRLRWTSLWSLFDQRGVADFEADEARHRNVLAKFRDGGFDQVRHCGAVLFDKWLFVETDLFVVFAHPPFDNLVHHFLGLAFRQSAGALDVTLLVESSL